jgi:hypothetical protein
MNPMMALLPIILFVTTDICEKVKIRRLKRCVFMQTMNIFPKTLRFLQFHLTKRMTFM